MHLTSTRFRRFFASALTAVLVLGTMQIDTAAAATATSSWSPTLLVNTESFQIIDAGDGTTDIELRFGSSANTLKYLTTGVFQFSKGLSVLGNISGSTLSIDRQATISGALTVKGTTVFKSAVTINSTLTSTSTISGSSLRISNNAGIQGPLAVSGAVRTDGNITINDDADTNDAVLTFGNNTANQTLKFLNTSQKFQFSKDLSVIGTISGSYIRSDSNLDVFGNLTASGTLKITGASTLNGAVTGNGTITAKTILSGSTIRASNSADIHGPLAVSGAVRTDGNITINDDADTNDALLTFGNTSGNQTIKFLNTGQKFQFSKALSVLGTISGSSLNVDRNATVGGSLTASGAIRTKSSLSGSTLTVDGNITLHGVTYSAPTSQGGSNTFLKNDGAGNLTWGTTSVGNGSGNLIALNPEYPNAIYFGSGANDIGQLSASGSLTFNENFYHWATTRSGIQDYWIAVRVRIPDNFSSWDPIKPIELRFRTADGTATNNHVTVRLKDTNNVLTTLSGAMVNSSFSTAYLRGPEAGGTFAPKGYITVLIKLAALTGKFAEVGFLNLNFETTTP